MAAPVFVCNDNSSAFPLGQSVSVIDPASWTVVHNIPSPGGVWVPNHCAVTPDGTKLVVCGQLGGAGVVAVFDTTSYTLINTVGLPPHCAYTYGATISPDGQHVYYISQGLPTFDWYIGKSSLSTYLLEADYDITTSAFGNFTGPQMAVTQDGLYLYAAAGSFKVAVLATAGMTLYATVTTTRAANQGCILSADVTQVFVSNTQSPGHVDVVDVATNLQVTQYDQDATYYNDYGLLATSGFLYLTEESLNTLGVFTIGTVSPQVAHVAVGATPHLIALTSDSAHLLVTNYADGPPGTVTVINVPANTVLTTVTVGDNPDGIATQPPSVIPPPTPPYPGSVFIPKLFIPNKGKIDEEYTEEELNANWTALSIWSQRWRPPAPTLFFPSQASGRLPTATEINANWEQAEIWSEQIIREGAPYPPLDIPRKRSMDPFDLDIDFLAFQRWANAIAHG